MHKIIVCGCGGMSNAWIEYALNRDDCEIVGLVDINIGAANTKKEKYNLNANVYDSIKAALEKENANLVFDITVPEAHYNTVCTALKAGCHVFGEKPMSDSLENAEKMVACANNAQKEYFVMQNYRYSPELHAFKSFLESGKLGNIGQISASFQIEIHFGGFRDKMDNPLIADMAIHTFDAARFITGKNPVSVFCHEFNPSWSWYQGDANAVCIFEMDDGSVFDYRGSWCAKGLNTPWQSTWRVSCENGAAFWDGADKLYYETSDGKKDVTVSPLKAIGHDAGIGEMFDAISNQTKPPTDCRDNIKSIRMVHKAIESSRMKQVVLL